MYFSGVSLFDVCVWIEMWNMGGSMVWRDVVVFCEAVRTGCVEAVGGTAL